MTPEQELAYIRQVITDSRQAFAEDGKPYILWGAVVAIGMTVSYISAITQRDFGTGWIWIGLCILGGLYMAFSYRKARDRQQKSAISFVDRLQGAIWGACGTALGLSILLIMIGYSDTAPSIPPIFTCSVAALILGIAYYLSGFALELKWLRNIGIAWWLGAIGMYFMRNVHVLAVYAGMIVLFQLVPGIILNRKYRQTQGIVGSNSPVHA